MANIKNQYAYDDNGKEHGEWLSYHSNGHLQYRSNWIHGVRHELQEGYYSDGTLMYRGYRNMGRRVGYWYDNKNKYYLWLI